MNLLKSGLDGNSGNLISSTMYLVALSFIRAVPQARKKFQQLVRAGRGKREALCLIAADLIKICLAMLKSGSKFDPKKI